MTLDELKLLLALNGNSRIEYAEREILASNETGLYYMRALSLECSNWSPNWLGNTLSSDLPWILYTYARDVINGRWLEAESVIASDKFVAGFYNSRFGTKLCS